MKTKFMPALVFVAAFVLSGANCHDDYPNFGKESGDDETTTETEPETETTPVEYQVALSSIDGAPDDWAESRQIYAEQPVTFHFVFNNTMDQAIIGFSYGILIYSGAEQVDWGTPSWTFAGISGDIMDVNDFITTEIDTVGFSIPELSAEISVGDIIEAFSVTIGPIRSEFLDHQVCIDSTGFIPEHPCEWRLSDHSLYNPTWANEICFTVVAPPE